jgi:hypothetical protein
VVLCRQVDDLQPICGSIRRTVLLVLPPFSSLLSGFRECLRPTWPVFGPFAANGCALAAGSAVRRSCGDLRCLPPLTPFACSLDHRLAAVDHLDDRQQRVDALAVRRDGFLVAQHDLFEGRDSLEQIVILGIAIRA